VPCIFICRFAKKLSPKSIYSEQGIYVLKYQVLMADLVDSPPKDPVGNGVGDPSSSHEEPSSSEDKSGKKGGGSGGASSTTNNEGSSDGTNPDQMEVEEVAQEWRYRFSNDIHVTLLIMADGLLVSGTYIYSIIF
jgi:hypothetical protein